MVERELRLMDLDQVSPFALWLSSVIYSNPWEQKYYSCTFQRTIPSHPTCLGRLGMSYDNSLTTGKAMESQQLFLVAVSRVGSDTDKFQERMLEPRRYAPINDYGVDRTRYDARILIYVQPSNLQHQNR
ncbi:hypothetical protein I7I50_10676 [Histoplasma capsulatum G186AR]|nr:hypothetical protein I7I52_01914 [Histoplasma capsulatum]QSS69396.1 hypothetical protein I7I50_10676 [Histoplasma capsulatum G186AR]